MEIEKAIDIKSFVSKLNLDDKSDEKDNLNVVNDINDVNTISVNLIEINAFIHTNSSRNIIIQAHYIKEENESDDKWFPLLIMAVLDYKDRYRQKRIILVNTGNDIQTKGLETTRLNFGTTSELDKITAEEKRKTLELKEELDRQGGGDDEVFDALGLGGQKKSKSSPVSGKNFMSTDLNSKDEVKVNEPISTYKSSPKF